MHNDLDLWQLLAGLGLFLFGMHLLEDSLSQLAGRSFKRLLRRHTSPPIRGVLAGAVATAALQSSSVVSLIVLAFVATGIVSLAGALSIVFGANLGTTATGWIIATVGFKLNFEGIALPLIAAGGAGVAVLRAQTRATQFSKLLLGFGLMLLALAYMKSGVTAASRLFDPLALAGQPLIVFLFAGMLVTAIVQSSSATVMLTLSALNAEILTLPAAVAVAIGADLGTTSTALLGTLAGSAAKKRVAAAIILFNVVTDIAAFALLPYLLLFIANVLGISDPLFTLVAFHSLFNLLGLGFFLPFITPLSRFLDTRFRDSHGSLMRHINPNDLSMPAAALENIKRETARLVDQVAAVNQASFGLQAVHTLYNSPDDRAQVAIFSDGAAYEAGYAAAKELEGAILAYCLDLQKVQLDLAESARLNQLIQTSRNAIHSAKCIRDTVHDLHQLEQSESDTFHAFAQRFRDYVAAFYGEIDRLRTVMPAELAFETLVSMKKHNAELHQQMHETIFEDVRSDSLNRLQASTLLNVNREIYNSNDSILTALSDLLLEQHTAVNFAGIR